MHIKLILLDLDGCIFHASHTLEESQRKKNSDWIVSTNLYLMSHILAELKQANYDKVILGYGTNRQDHKTDDANSYNSTTLALVLPLISQYLSKKFRQVFIEPFLMADIFGVDKKNREVNEQFKPAGDSYKSILHHHYANQNEPQESTVPDKTKLTLIYAHLHRAASLHPNDTISVDFYDDTRNILSSLGNFYSKHPEMLPANVEINFIPYNGTFFDKKITIKGTGAIDYAYPWTVRYFATENKTKNLLDFDATKLQASAQDFGYALTMNELNNYSNLDQVNVLQNATLQLPAQPTLTNAAYTTSEQLAKEGLLPPSLLNIAIPPSAATAALMHCLFQREKNTPRPLEYITLDEIRHSVAQAVQKYQEWFLNKQPHRGREGLFTRLRHGQTGQNRAQRLLTNLNSDLIDTTDGALSVIKDVLTADKTRFHRHSFASFLMDELSALVQLSQQDLYDQARVQATYQLN